MTGVAYLRLAQQLMTTVSKSSRSSSPLTAAHTGLTPRLREMGGASLRPNLQMMELLRAHGYCNKLHVVGSSKLVAIDLEADRDGEMIDDEPPMTVSAVSASPSFFFLFLRSVPLLLAVGVNLSPLRHAMSCAW